MSRESAFDRLHPALQHHIVNSLGWTSLRPLQERAIPPVLDGDHALLLAPTAGGKTEAAVFPLLSRMLTEGWSGLSVLYVCPIKALLNDLELRLRTYGTLVGRRVDRWHGDVGAARRRAILQERPDLLLTTPESIEVMLVSSRSEPRVLFRDLQAVVVDELHAFAGDDRGWHLLAVLERVRRLAGREIQRLGLSATIGNPRALLDWLAPASSRPRRVVAPGGDAAGPASAHLDHVGSIRNAAKVISALHRGEKRLVFCDSRAGVEALSAELRQCGAETFVSHSSLALDERRRAEEAFSQSRDCVIVATSTLELGVEGERAFGRRHFMELMSVFTSEPLFSVRHGRTELGLVHPLSFHVHRGGPVVLLLAGRSWEVSHVDWNHRIAYVKVTTEKGRSPWVAPGIPLSFDLCRAIRRVLAEGSFGVEASQRARIRLDEIRQDFSWVDATDTAMVRDRTGANRWWTFAGLRANTVLGELSGPLRLPTAREDNLWIRLRDGVGIEELKLRLHRATSDATAGVFPIADDAVDSLKFSACLPRKLAARTLRQRGSDARGVRACLREPIRQVTLG